MLSLVEQKKIKIIAFIQGFKRYDYLIQWPQMFNCIEVKKLVSWLRQRALSSLSRVFNGTLMQKFKLRIVGIEPVVDPMSLISILDPSAIKNLWFFIFDEADMNGLILIPAKLVSSMIFFEAKIINVITSMYASELVKLEPCPKCQLLYYLQTNLYDLQIK